MKTCSKCKIEKHDILFYTKRRSLICKMCSRASALDRYHRSDKTKVKELMLKWRSNNRDRIRELEKIKRQRWKEKVLNHYSRVCVCCGEKDTRFLSVDHINGGGLKHRRESKISCMWRWLIDNEFPEGFQILCHNCNQAKYHYGKCPHLQIES